MGNRTVKIVIGMATIIVLLAWAPWFDTKSVHDRVLMEKGRIDQTIDEKGSMVCDYGVTWIPFGRYAASCEGGWFITFWGQIL